MTAETPGDLSGLKIDRDAPPGPTRARFAAPHSSSAPSCFRSRHPRLPGPESGSGLGPGRAEPVRTESRSARARVESAQAFRFQVTPTMLLWGMIFAAVMGAIGGFYPSRKAARRVIVEALREA